MVLRLLTHAHARERESAVKDNIKFLNLTKLLR